MGRDIKLIPLARCEICQGKGESMGIFHLLECAACDGTGLVDEATGLALEPRAMVAQLLVRLAAQEQAAKPAEGGPGADYVGRKNNHHRGGGNWTGD